MGKGLSQLQRAILEILDRYPSLESSMDGGRVDMKGWCRPSDLLDALGRTRRSGERAAISKALSRLCERGLVYKGFGEVASVGKGGRYARILSPGAVIRQEME